MSADYSSSSGFMEPGSFSKDWTDISCFQVRSRNALYVGTRYGRRFIIKSIKKEFRPFTEYQILHEKEFRLGISLAHPNIATTYSMEEVEDLGLCIVQEYVEGTTLGAWLEQNPSLELRKRAFLQLLDALKYIHSLQLVHHDLKLSNIMVTSNGNNVKLIDFGLSNTDDAVLTETNDVRKDIIGVGKIMKRMFASSGLFGTSRYPITTRRSLHGEYENIAALRKAFLHSNVVAKWLYVLLILVLVALCAGLINERVQEKMKQQEIMELVRTTVDKDIRRIYDVINATNTYIDATKALSQIYTIAMRDSLVNLYSEDPASAIYAGTVWDQYFTSQYNTLLQELRTNRTKWPYPWE